MGNEVELKEKILELFEKYEEFIVSDHVKGIYNCDYLEVIDNILELIDIKTPSEWVKLADEVPTVEDVGDKVIVYQVIGKVLYFAKTSTLKDFINKENNLWKKVDLPKGEECGEFIGTEDEVR